MASAPRARGLCERCGGRERQILGLGCNRQSSRKPGLVETTETGADKSDKVDPPRDILELSAPKPSSPEGGKVLPSIRRVAGERLGKAKPFLRGTGARV